MTLPVIASGSTDCSVKVWRRGMPDRLLHVFRGIEGTVASLAFNPSGTLLAVDGLAPAFRVFEIDAESEAPANRPKDVGAETQTTSPSASTSEDDEWEDILAQLTPGDVSRTGNGWMLEDGELFSPESFGIMTSPCEVSGVNYRVRITLRRMGTNKSIHVVLPVGDRMCGLDLDGQNGNDPYTTGLVTVNGKWGMRLPGVIKSRQVTDFERHDLEIVVRVLDSKAFITTQLDGKALYDWSGPVTALQQSNFWADKTEPGKLALGTRSAWAVSAVKVKRLDEKKPTEQ